MSDLPDLEAIATIAAALADEAHGDADEISAEAPSEAAPDAGVHPIVSHTLRCRQGLGNAYVYDTSWFHPPATGHVWTRAAFYNSSGARLLLTGWRDMGGANPYRPMGNTWTWKSTAVARSLVLWYEDTAGVSWNSWANCG